MQNDTRDRLIEIISQSHCVTVWDYCNYGEMGRQI